MSRITVDLGRGTVERLRDHLGDDPIAPIMRHLLIGWSNHEVRTPHFRGTNTLFRGPTAIRLNVDVPVGSFQRIGEKIERYNAGLPSDHPRLRKSNLTRALIGSHLLHLDHSNGYHANGGGP